MVSIGVGESYCPPRPPNRTGGFPAYGSPVGGFLIGVVSLLPSGVKCEPFGIREGGNCPFNAVASADSMRSVHTSASAHAQFRWVGVSAPCLATSALAVLLCPGMVFAHPPSCPAFPRTGFASPSFRGPCTRPQRYYAGSDSCCASPTQQVSPLRSLAFPASRPQPRYAARSSRAYLTSCHRSALAGQTSPYMSKLATARRRIGFVILRAVGSPPAALHLASRRRSCLQLHVR